MTTSATIAGHYESGDLAQRLEAALRDDGADPARPTIEALTPYDQFHGRGMEATEELANALEVGPEDHVLDIGSGIGGPARYFADRFGCQVSGIDLTAEFCELARSLTERLGMQDRVRIEQGNALDMPFADATFSGAYSMNVSMNIADKDAFYREIHRVLRPGAWLALSEIAKGPGGDMMYPTPWAETAASSFLATPEDTRARLEANGFSIVQFRDAKAEVLDFGDRSRELVEQGHKPPQRAVFLIHGELAAEAARNTAKGVAEDRIVPIELICRKAG